MLYLILHSARWTYGLKVNRANLASVLTRYAPTSILPDLFPLHPVTRI